jgi:DNA-binding MurR/RpiR family transcriptional regulator
LKKVQSDDQLAGTTFWPRTTMPEALPKIRSLAASLPAAERSIAERILADPERAARSSVRELASRGRVSVGSVSRFVRTLGFADFRSFRLALARETAHPTTSLFEAIRPGDSDDEIARKVFLGNIRSLEDTLKLVATPDLAAAARAIGKAGRLVFFGIGSSGNIARDAALLFSFMELASVACVDPYQIVVQSTQARAADVYVGLSHSGRSAITVEGLAQARRRGAVTVGISNYPRSPLARVSRYFFCTSFPESRVNVAALTSRLAQLCILDALYLLTARHRGRVRSIEEANILTERLLRTRGRAKHRTEET